MVTEQTLKESVQNLLSSIEEKTAKMTISINGKKVVEFETEVCKHAKETWEQAIAYELRTQVFGQDIEIEYDEKTKTFQGTLEALWLPNEINPEWEVKGTLKD